MPEKAPLHLDHTAVSASCWRNLGSRNTRQGTTKICSGLSVLEKGRQGRAEPDMTLFWQAVLAESESALAPVSSGAGQGVPLLPHLLPAVPCAAHPGLLSLQEPCPEAPGLPPSSVLFSSFREGSLLFTSTVFPQKWHRIEIHVVVLHRREGDQKCKLHLQSNWTRWQHFAASLPALTREQVWG